MYIQLTGLYLLNIGFLACILWTIHSNPPFVPVGHKLLFYRHSPPPPNSSRSFWIIIQSPEVLAIQFSTICKLNQLVFYFITQVTDRNIKKSLPRDILFKCHCFPQGSGRATDNRSPPLSKHSRGNQSWSVTSELKLPVFRPQGVLNMPT